MTSRGDDTYVILETRTENTICLHYLWDKLRDTVHDVCTKCYTCQMIYITHGLVVKLLLIEL